MQQSHRRTANHPAPNPLIVFEWGDLRRGDIVRVRSLHGTFTFHSVQYSEAGEVRWVTVIGPKGFRAFPPESVLVPTARKLQLQRERGTK